jgi:Uma2 family endonuclease
LDMKVRPYISATHLFYYPDVMVTCEPRDSNRYFKRFPKVLVEVLSPETERTDRREKFVGYTQIESLKDYVLIAQDKVDVTLHSRANGWQPEVLTKADQQLRFSSLDFGLTLSAIYEGVQVCLFMDSPRSLPTG